MSKKRISQECYTLHHDLCPIPDHCGCTDCDHEEGGAGDRAPLIPPTPILSGAMSL